MGGSAERKYGHDGHGESAKAGEDHLLSPDVDAVPMPGHPG
jgi:hypothetical protein